VDVKLVQDITCVVGTLKRSLSPNRWLFITYYIFRLLIYLELHCLKVEFTWRMSRDVPYPKSSEIRSKSGRIVNHWGWKGGRERINGEIVNVWRIGRRCQGKGWHFVKDSAPFWRKLNHFFRLLVPLDETLRELALPAANSTGSMVAH